MKVGSYEYRKMLTKGGAQFVLIGMPTVCLKNFPTKTTKILSTRNSNIFMMSSAEHLFSESDCSSTKYICSCLNSKFVSMVTVFENEGVFR